MPQSPGGLTRREALKVLTAGLGAGILTAGGLLRFRQAQTPMVLRHARPMLGTLVTITIHHPDLGAAEAAMHRAFAAIDAVDRVMSLHREASDLVRVNRAAGRAMVAVDPSLCEVLATASAVHAAGAGAYDVSCLPVMRLYGFYAGGARGRYPTDRAVRAVLDCVGHRFIAIDAAAARVGLTRADAGIDLGSIGKGYA
ncbi:MAG: FAD:protein FMN transferase, partial [Deltaproteobacteria bacterium]|nr:FAD:protein FMN transferase [Deltaproteobacteria bacterium]